MTEFQLPPHRAGDRGQPWHRPRRRPGPGPGRRPRGRSAPAGGRGLDRPV